MERFGEFIRRARKKQEMTIETVAKKMGSHKGYVSGMETGNANPGSPKVVTRLASALRLDTDQLLLRAYVEKAPLQIRQLLAKAIFPNE